MADGITLKIEGIAALMRRLDGLALNAKKIMRNAINDTASHTRSVAVKAITSEWNIKAKDVRSTFRVRRATSASLQAEVTSQGRPIPLLYFAAKQGPQGVRYRVKKQGGRELLRRGWINRLRRGQAVGIRRALSRLPITAPAVPGVYHAWRQRLPEQLPEISAFLRRRVEQLIALELQRRA